MKRYAKISQSGTFMENLHKSHLYKIKIKVQERSKILCGVVTLFSLKSLILLIFHDVFVCLLESVLSLVTRILIFSKHYRYFFLKRSICMTYTVARCIAPHQYGYYSLPPRPYLSSSTFNHPLISYAFLSSPQPTIPRPPIHFKCLHVSSILPF